jgi:hypothetical protein
VAVREVTVALAAGCLALAACGCAPPGGGSETTGRATAETRGARATSAPPRAATGAALIGRANRTHEYPAPVPRQSVIGGWHSAVQAVEVFAATYINWTARTVSARLTALAEVSVDQARSAMLLAASETAKDYELQRSGVANSGAVEVVAPLPGHPGQFVVVTREQTTATSSSAYQGLAAAWHVTLATVARVAGGLWVLSRWQPES